MNWLKQLYGPETKVSVDYYVTKIENDDTIGPMLAEGFQRESISHRWKFNGMTPDDVAIIGNLDETFSRDFLRALQICDVTQFRPGQSCKSPKVTASTQAVESSPECAWKGRRLQLSVEDTALDIAKNQDHKPKTAQTNSKLLIGSHQSLLC